MKQRANYSSVYFNHQGFRQKTGRKMFWMEWQQASPEFNQFFIYS
jgi:hypothetical protein